MTDLLTAEQMRAIERAAIESGAVTGAERMERAGRGVVEAVFAEWPHLAVGACRAEIPCGPRTLRARGGGGYRAGGGRNGGQG